MNDNNLKIYIVSHKRTFIPKCQYLIPIQVGCEKSTDILEEFVHDNTGINISRLNADYCELTALYWMWKNDNASYVGLFHYRRYLILESQKMKKYMKNWKNFYYIESLTQNEFNKLGFNNKEYILSIMNYDILIPQCSNLTYRNIDTFYKLYERSLKKELDYALEIVLMKYPQYYSAIEECKMSSKGYHCNMFIMKREILEEYCEWLFSVLDTMYDDIKRGKFVTDKERLIGYIGEFMMGIFICKKRDELNIKELPIAFFHYTDGKRHLMRACANSLIRRVYRFCIPIGSKKESYIFKVLDTIRCF